MTHTDKALEAWNEVALQLRMILEKPEISKYSTQWEEIYSRAEASNAWFTRDQIRLAAEGILKLLEPEKLISFVRKYGIVGNQEPKNVGVIMAGNIPAAGFHDLLCVSLVGHRLHAKLSSSDQFILPFLVELLRNANSAVADRISFAENLKNMDAVIATGSDNSSRYFEYYFGNKPHIFRRNRNSIAILTGNENEYDLLLLGRDIFSYFGLGCRSISKLLVPEGYSFDNLFESLIDYKHLMQHSRYMNNHDYHQSLYLLSQEPFLTNNFVIIKEDVKLSSPVGVVYYETHSGLDDAMSQVDAIREKLQCVVMKGGAITPGFAQLPNIDEFADGVNTIDFLKKI